MKKYRLIPVLAAGLVAASSLAGCAVVDTLRNEGSASFATTTELSESWAKTAPWLPADAVDIKIREATNGDTAMLRATTSTDLDPAKCAEIDRQSAPVYAQDWAPDPYVDKAWVCDNWTVIPTDDGWFGWTPNDPDEQALSPGN